MRLNIDTYNSPESLLVISSYPEPRTRYSGKVCAVGGYTKNTLDALKSIKSYSKFAILTVTIGKKRTVYEENGRLVWRLFERNNIGSYISMLKAILSFGRVKDVLIEFEFASFGDTKISLLYPLITFVSRLSGKNTILVLHQVVENIQELNGHLGWNQKTIWSDIRSLFYTLGLRVFYHLLTWPCNRVVVLEEEFKNRLSRMVGQDEKMVTIPHGVDTHLKTISKSAARKKLGLPLNKEIILYFGYLTWYKGADLFYRMAFQNKKNGDTHYVMAGGKSFTQKAKKHYQNYVSQFSTALPNLTITGFLHERQIPYYFSAADLVVLPYRVMMSSSGPLSTSFSFAKSLILSDRLVPYAKSADFKQAMNVAQLKKSDLFINNGNLNNAVEHAPAGKLAHFAREMKKLRSYKQNAIKLAQLFISGTK